MELKHIADRTGPRASTILSYRILGFITIHDLRHSWIFHGGHGDPMGTPWGPMGSHGNPWGPMGTHGNPWIFHGCSINFRGGRGSGRQKMWGGVGGAGAPPTNSLGAVFEPKNSKFELSNSFSPSAGPVRILFDDLNQIQ